MNERISTRLLCLIHTAAKKVHANPANEVEFINTKMRDGDTF